MIKKYNFEIIFTTIFLVISLAITKIGIKLDISSGQEILKLVEVLFNNLIALITIWFSAYFILIQLYKNTYPMEIIEKEYLKKVKRIVLLAIFTIFYGMLVFVFYSSNMIINTYFIFLFSLNILTIIVNTYMINRDLAINTYVDKYFNKLYKKLDNKNKKANKNEKDLENTIDNTFQSLEKFFNECIIKDEYSVCNNISEKVGIFFEKLICQCNNLLLQGKKETSEYCFEKIIEFNIKQIKMAHNCKVSSFYNELIDQQVKNIEYCIEIGNFEWFKKYISEMNLLNESNNIDKKISSKIFYMNESVASKLLTKEESWIKEFFEILFETYIPLNKMEENNKFENIGIILILTIIEDLENSKKEESYESKYKILKNILKEYTEILTGSSEKLVKVPFFYALYGRKLLRFENKERASDFIKILISPKNTTMQDITWNTMILDILSKTTQKWENEFGEENRKRIIKFIIYQCLQEGHTGYYIFLPDYKELIEKNSENNVQIGKYLKEMEKFLFRMVINDVEKMVYKFLDKLDDIMLNTKKEEIIIELIRLYTKALKKVPSENKKLFGYIVVRFIDIIEKLDKDHKVSEKIAKEIIDGLATVAELEDNQERIIDLIYVFVKILEQEEEIYYFVATNKIKKKYIYKKLYNIGTTCLESQMYEALKHISNILGWEIIENMKRKNIELADYALSRAIDIYKISKALRVPYVMRQYLMTLFTTVGPYTFKSNEYYRIQTHIILFLKEEKSNLIDVSIELRTKENDMWDDLYENQTQSLVRKFREKISTIKKENPNSENVNI